MLLMSKHILLQKKYFSGIFSRCLVEFLWLSWWNISSYWPQAYFSQITKVNRSSQHHYTLKLTGRSKSIAWEKKCVRKTTDNLNQLSLKLRLLFFIGLAKEADLPCEDKAKYCTLWGQRNFCYISFVYYTCRKTCIVCDNKWWVVPFFLILLNY